MMVKIGELRVDVLDAQCPERPCYSLGFDKGHYVKGRGYIHYHDKERPVCMTRHLHGCPPAGVCLTCKSMFVHGTTQCSWCKTPLEPHERA